MLCRCWLPNQPGAPRPADDYYNVDASGVQIAVAAPLPPAAVAFPSTAGGPAAVLPAPVGAGMIGVVAAAVEDVKPAKSKREPLPAGLVPLQAETMLCKAKNGILKVSHGLMAKQI